MLSLALIYVPLIYATSIDIDDYELFVIPFSLLRKVTIVLIKTRNAARMGWGRVKALSGWRISFRTLFH